MVLYFSDIQYSRRFLGENCSGSELKKLPECEIREGSQLVGITSRLDINEMNKGTVVLERSFSLFHAGRIRIFS